MSEPRPDRRPEVKGAVTPVERRLSSRSPGTDLDDHPVPVPQRMVMGPHVVPGWRGRLLVLALAVIASTCLAVPFLRSSTSAIPMRIGQPVRTEGGAIASAGASAATAVNRQGDQGGYRAQLDRVCGTYLRTGAMVPTPNRGDEQGLADYLDQLAGMTGALGDLVNETAPPASLLRWHEQISQAMKDMAINARRMAVDLREHQPDAYPRDENRLNEAAARVATAGQHIGSARCQAVGTY
jgi:hypothetical protein